MPSWLFAQQASHFTEPVSPSVEREQQEPLSHWVVGKIK